jgi:HSP20 family protein
MERTMHLTRYRPAQRMVKRTGGPRFFDDFLDDFFAPTMNSPKEMMGLKVDIYERDEHIVIDAELPGMKREDISVDVKGKLLTLGGERKSEDEVEQQNYYRRERRHGKFERTFNLPFELSEEHVVAKYEDGVLTLEIAKPQEQVAKKIAIN